MRERLRIALRVAALAGFMVLLHPARALQVTDDRGVQVTLARSPQRIVSLFPSLTESVCALGQCQRLVGVDRYSNFPVSVRSLPQVGGGLDPSIEAIVALKPDLVLMATSTRGAAQLQALGIPVVALQPRTHTDIQRVLERVGDLLEVPPQQGAQRVWQNIQAALSAASQSVPEGLKGTRIYFEVSSGPYAASEASFIGETLERLGLRNVVPGKLGPYPKLNPEFIVRADPDLIMTGEGSADTISQRPGWARLRAIRDHRVCAFTPAQADVAVRAGPRLAEGAQLMAQCLMKHGERGQHR